LFIDTHCHLNFDPFDNDREAVIKRTKEEGIDYIINIGSDLESSRQSVDLSREHDFIYATVGVHPHHAQEVTPDVIADLKLLAQANNKVVAVGEVGLDYFRNLSPKDVQQKVFRGFIALAAELNLPLIIHDRDAHDDVLAILSDNSCPGNRQKKKSQENTGLKFKGVVHCFSGDEALAEEFIKLGFNISFTGNITFKKAEALREVVKAVPIEKILLETDAPFLAPQALRGKRNEPANVKYIAEEIARIKGLSVEDIARITSLNAKKLFSLGGIEDKGKIVYPIRDSLYVNITNRCTNDCTFCIRTSTDFVKGHNLKLDSEPTAEEIMQAIGDASEYREVVFCGYGEPLTRLDVVLDVAGQLKAKSVHIRINTNGHGNLIHSRSVVKDLAGLIDEVSVSLDADTSEKYDHICQPKFGPGTFDKVKEFILECKQTLPKVGITFITVPEVDIDQCRKLAAELGVSYRIRQYNEVG